MANKLTIAKGKGAIPNIGYQFDGAFRKGTTPTLLDSRQARRVKSFIENLVFRSMFEITTGAPPANSFQVDFSNDQETWFRLALQTALHFDPTPHLGGNLRLHGFNIVASGPGSKFIQHSKIGFPIHPQNFPSDTVDAFGANIRLFGWDSGTPYNVGFRCPPATDLAGSSSLDADNGLIWVLPYEDGSDGQVLQTDGNGVLSWGAGGGGGGAPTGASYVVISADSTLTHERVLTAGTGITITDGGANSTVTIAATGGGGGMTSFTVASLRWTNPFDPSPVTSSYTVSNGEEIEFWSYNKSISCSASTSERMNIEIPYGEILDGDGELWGHNAFVVTDVDGSGSPRYDGDQQLICIENRCEYNSPGEVVVFSANHNEHYEGWEDGWRFLRFHSGYHAGDQMNLRLGRQVCTDIDCGYNGDPLDTGDGSATTCTLVYDGGTITSWYGDTVIGGEEGDGGEAGHFKLEAGPGIHLVVDIFGTTTYNIGLLHHIDEDDTGQYGSATKSPVLTVNKQGVITDISEVTITGGGGGGSGTVTSIGTGNGLDGGTITTSGTLTVDSTVAQTVSISADGGTASGDSDVSVGNSADNAMELVAGDGVTLTGDDSAGTIKIESSGGGGGCGTLPESAHPYPADSDESWEYECCCASSIDVTFDSSTSVEEDYDYIYIYDGDDVQISGSPFTGTELASATKTISGSKVKIRLTSDGSVQEYGFKVDSIVSSGGGGSGAPTDASYVVIGADSTLTDERVLTAGSNITITDGGAGGNVTIAATGGGGGGSLTVEEVDGSPSVSSVDTIVVSNGTLTDDGGGQVTIAIDGQPATTAVNITSGTSSTVPNDGTDYLIGMTDYDPGDNYLLTIPRPGDVAVGRRFQFWLENTSSYYFAVQTSDSSDLFQTSYDLYNDYGAFQYLETYLDSPVIFTIYSDGLSTWYSDNAAFGGEWWGTSSPS